MRKIYLAAQTLNDFSKKLPELMFLRVHRSHIVNRMSVMILKNKPKTHLELFDSTKIPVSRERSTHVRDMLHDLW